MTTIAWDGKRVAADKRAMNNGKGTTVTKLFRSVRCPDTILAISGDSTNGLQMIEWFDLHAAAPEKLPEFQKTNNFVPMLKVTEDGAWLYETGHIPFRIEDKYFAMGSGRDYALAALYMGRSASEAVQVAAAFDTGTGNGIDVMRPQDIPRHYESD